MICVDASVAVKWVLPEEHANAARNLYLTALAAANPVIAPPLFPIEVTNILYQQVRRHGRLSAAAALTLLDDFLAFPVELRNPDGLHRDALAIAAEVRLSATYDAHYLALAQRLGCDFWTADRRLVRQSGETLPFVRWIGDFDPSPDPAERG